MMQVTKNLEFYQEISLVDENYTLQWAFYRYYNGDWYFDNNAKVEMLDNKLFLENEYKKLLRKDKLKKIYEKVLESKS